MTCGKTVSKGIFTLSGAYKLGITFSSILQASPHIPQMCKADRYIHIEDNRVEIKKPALGFFPIAGRLLLSSQNR